MASDVYWALKDRLMIMGCDLDDQTRWDYGEPDEWVIRRQAQIDKLSAITDEVQKTADEFNAKELARFK